jgi:hypothetical protein
MLLLLALDRERGRLLARNQLRDQAFADSKISQHCSCSSSHHQQQACGERVDSANLLKRGKLLGSRLAGDVSMDPSLEGSIG